MGFIFSDSLNAPIVYSGAFEVALIQVQDRDIMMAVMVSIQELTLTAQMFDSFSVQ